VVVIVRVVDGRKKAQDSQKRLGRIGAVDVTGSRIRYTWVSVLGLGGQTVMSESRLE
jgi:hypothetical protein